LKLFVGIVRARASPARASKSQTVRGQPSSLQDFYICCNIVFQKNSCLFHNGKYATPQKFMSLTHKQYLAIQMLINDATDKEIIASCGCSRTTLHRWKKNPEFQAAITSVKQQTDSIFKEEIARRHKELIENDVDAWKQRQLTIREHEWLASEKLFALGMTMLESVNIEEKRWTMKDVTSILETGSNLARLSSEMWNKDLNAAIQLVLKYGYEIVDKQLPIQVDDDKDDE